MALAVAARHRAIVTPSRSSIHRGRCAVVAAAAAAAAPEATVTAKRTAPQKQQQQHQRQRKQVLRPTNINQTPPAAPVNALPGIFLVCVGLWTVSAAVAVGVAAALRAAGARVMEMGVLLSCPRISLSISVACTTHTRLPTHHY
jgi:hypothetical protein